MSEDGDLIAISFKADKSREYLVTKLAGLADVHDFPIPADALRVGTLDSLMSLSDDIVRSRVDGYGANSGGATRMGGGLGGTFGDPASLPLWDLGRSPPRATADQVAQNCPRSRWARPLTRRHRTRSHQAKMDMLAETTCFKLYKQFQDLNDEKPPTVNGSARLFRLPPCHTLSPTLSRPPTTHARACPCPTHPPPPTPPAVPPPAPPHLRPAAPPLPSRRVHVRDEAVGLGRGQVPAEDTASRARRDHQRGERSHPLPLRETPN